MGTGIGRPTNQVRAILEALAEAGILALARREGNRRVYDLAERLLPADLLAMRPGEEEQRRHKLLSRYRAHGLLGMSGGQGEVWIGTGAAADRYRSRDTLVEQGVVVPVTVEGVRGPRLVLRDELPWLEAATSDVEAASSEAGVAFLAPLDPLAWDRDLLRSLFDFDYVWEVAALERTPGSWTPIGSPGHARRATVGWECSSGSGSDPPGD